MPWGSRPAKPRGHNQLNNAPIDITHNHADGQGHVVYAGYSTVVPDYHLFRCIASSPPPRRKVVLIPFDRGYFTPESKAGQGGCSMRGCPRDAEAMNRRGTQAYCTRCSGRARGIVPCPSTLIEPCHRRLNLDWPPYGVVCPTCEAFKETAA